MGFNPMVAPVVQQTAFPKVETGAAVTTNSAWATALNMHLDGSNAGAATAAAAAAAAVAAKTVGGETKTVSLQDPIIGGFQALWGSLTPTC